MENKKQTRSLLTEHFNSYPKLQINDIFKYLFQSSFGCEHLLSDEASAIDYIKREHEASTHADSAETDRLDGAYIRVPLSLLSKGLSAETLGKLFCRSAVTEPDGKKALTAKLQIARELISEGTLPFSTAEFDSAAAEWAQSGYPAVHHSEVFREAYRPAYRVISNVFVRFLPLFTEIDRKLASGCCTVAIEGGSASGKTTLASQLSDIYDCTVFHMDDFFLRPEQRTPERFAEIGGNVDRERFLREVMLPLKQGMDVQYRRFDCSTFQLLPAVTVTPKKLVIIEGAYSMHPELAPYFDLSVFLDIGEDLQRARIQKRNSPWLAKRFFEEWIPMENRYFAETSVKDRCDLTVGITTE